MVTKSPVRIPRNGYLPKETKAFLAASFVERGITAVLIMDKPKNSMPKPSITRPLFFCFCFFIIKFGLNVFSTVHFDNRHLLSDKDGHLN